MPHSQRSPLLRPAVATLAALLLVVAGCARGTDTEEPADAAPQGVETSSGRVAVGSALEDDGSIAAGRQSRNFSAGDTIHVSFAPDPDAAAAQVELVWYGPDGLEVDADSVTADPGQAHVPFATDTTGWQPGTYRGEVWYGNELAEELEIELMAAGGAA